MPTHQPIPPASTCPSANPYPPIDAFPLLANIIREGQTPPLLNIGPREVMDSRSVSVTNGNLFIFREILWSFRYKFGGFGKRENGIFMRLKNRDDTLNSSSCGTFHQKTKSPRLAQIGQNRPKSAKISHFRCIVCLHRPITVY